MTDSGTVDMHINPYEYVNDIRVNLLLSCDISFALRYFIKPEMRYIGILLNHSHAHYIGLLVTGFGLLSH